MSCGRRILLFLAEAFLSAELLGAEEKTAWAGQFVAGACGAVQAAKS